MHELRVNGTPSIPGVRGSSDPVERWIPLNHTIAINKLLGFDNRVAMSNRPDHAPSEDSNKIIYAFLEYFLK